MENIKSSAIADAAHRDAWTSGDTGPREEQRILPALVGPTRLPENPHLPAPRAARVAGTGLIEHTAATSRRPLAQLPNLQSEKSGDQAFLCRLPDELLIQIGECLLTSPDISSLEAAALASRRLYGVFSSVLMHAFPNEKAQYMEWLRSAPLTAGNDLRYLFASIRNFPLQAQPYLVHDAIDYVDKNSLGDKEKSLILVALLRELPKLISQAKLPSALARLVPCHNRLSGQEQGRSLVAIAELIKQFAAGETSEPWIAGLTHTLVTKKNISHDLRGIVICELADLTGLVSDDKKPIHILNVLALIGSLPERFQQTCHFHLLPYREYITVSQLGGPVIMHFGQQLTNKLLGFFGSGTAGITDTIDQSRAG